MPFIPIGENSMKIYTKSGDKGETGLLGGIRVSKSHLVIGVCGTLDEANSLIGLARSHIATESSSNANPQTQNDVDLLLGQIQNDLFDLGSRVAACLGESHRPPEFPVARAIELERQIDLFQAELPPLTAFILPGGNLFGSTLHLSRSVCRRAERELVQLIESKPGSDLSGSNSDGNLSVEMVYLNRLSDLLFVLARIANVRAGQPETQWNVGRGDAAGSEG